MPCKGFKDTAMSPRHLGVMHALPAWVSQACTLLWGGTIVAGAGGEHGGHSGRIDGHKNARGGHVGRLAVAVAIAVAAADVAIAV